MSNIETTQYCDLIDILVDCVASWTPVEQDFYTWFVAFSTGHLSVKDRQNLLL